MASTRKLNTKDGVPFYEISVSRGRGLPRITTRWYPPAGWSQKAIDRKLVKVAVAFEQKVKAGEVITRQEERIENYRRELEAAQIKTLKQYGETAYMASLAIHCSENTRTSYQGNLNKWIYPVLGDFKLPEVTSAQITALLLSIQSQNKSHSTVIKVYTVLQGLFKMAYLADLIDRNPMDKVQRPRPRKDEVKTQEAEAYTVEEIRHIWNCLSQEPLKWRAMIRLLIDTGIRRGECCGLQWKDVDFEKNTITICGNLCYTPDKGIYLDTPKNGRSRTIDVDSRIIALLRELRLEQSKKPSANMCLPKKEVPSLSIPKVLPVTCKTLQGNTASRACIPTSSAIALPVSLLLTAQTSPVCRKSWGIQTKLSLCGCIPTLIRRA